MNHFKAIFLVGGPGSGKDFLIHSTLNELHIKEVSMERVFTAIVKESNIEELTNFPSVIVNGNADNLDKIVVTKAILEEMGYDTSMIYVYTTDESSKSRNDFRLSRGAKTFTESTRKEKYNSSVTNLQEYAEMFDSFLLYDNSNNFITVNEEKKQEITSWLTELTETVVGFLAKSPSNQAAQRWIQERVMEVGTKSTAQFYNIITPGQFSDKVRTYAEADKIVPGPKYTGKQNPRDGNKYTGGGVAIAGNPPGSNQRVVNSEELKIPQKKSKFGTGRKSTKPSDYASTGAKSSSYGSGDIGVASTSGQTYEGHIPPNVIRDVKDRRTLGKVADLLKREKQNKGKTGRIPSGENGLAPQSFSGITEIVDVHQTRASSFRFKDKFKQAIAPPENAGPAKNYGGEGQYSPSGQGPMDEKKKSFKKFKTNPPVTPKQTGVTYGSGIGNAQPNFNSSAAVGMMDYKEEVGKKKKLKKIKDNPNTSALNSVGNENETGQASLTSLSPSTNESKSFDRLRSGISSSVNNLDKLLEN